MLSLAIVDNIGAIGVRGVPVYLVLGGFIWLAIDASGVHATIAGVIVGLR
jgi:NhaA family Na+:H+ antiporter